ncbi:uncharacterized protein LOC126748784 [Anthonomus grandis grandis]|uniref:uncharacterized protein LOC126748784 n=1 Tax=Anthonomus grandis grandis TaxID=2921223 RepID=UPI002165FFC5|nr:uncharacterized protein LOC126748784 [Anthonomus grandis grandis]
MLQQKARVLVAAAAFFILAANAISLIQDQQKQGRRRRFKINPKNSKGRHRIANQYQYLKEIRSLDNSQFFNHTRMTRLVFEKLLQKIKPMICRQRRSDGITGELRLLITLKYLSQGTSMQSLAWTFQIGFTTVHQIINETCKAIWDVLHSEYLKLPTREQWLEIAKGFKNQWKFPNCIGAIDGKHINVQPTAHDSSLKDFSIVLLVACDHKYRFTMVDIGAYETQRDGIVSRNSQFGTKWDENHVDMPEECVLPVTNVSIPYFFVGNEAFPLKNHVIRPYTGKNLNSTQEIFNRYQNAASKVIENAFGILVSRWPVLNKKINAKPDKVYNIIKSVIVLHNYCLTELQDGEENIYCPWGYTDDWDIKDGDWREEQDPLQSVGRMAAKSQKKIVNNMRDTLAEYFMKTDSTESAIAASKELF